MKRKWWLIGAGALCAALLSLCLFGVRVRVFPRLILSRALNSTLTQLETRFADSPIHLLGKALDSQGRQQAQLQLETEHEHLGIVYYDMTLHTQAAPCRIRADGTVVAGGTALDMSLYLDSDFAAVSSQGLVDGTWYGITYDTFSRDIRERSLLVMLAGEQTISGWESSVENLQKAMSVSMSVPELSAEDVKDVLFGALALKPQVEREESCYCVTFRAAGQEIAEAVESYQDRLSPEILALIDQMKDDAESEAAVVFFLDDGKLTGIQATLIQKGKQTEFTIDLGESAASDILILELESSVDGFRDRCTMKIDTVSKETEYAETVNISRTQNGIQQKLALDYSWDLSSGEMALMIQRDGQKANLRLNLAGEGESITVTAQDISPLINLFLEKPLGSAAICTVKVSPGAAVEVPQYRSLSQWSMEDLLTLLAGFGGLLGLNIT